MLEQHFHTTLKSNIKNFENLDNARNINPIKYTKNKNKLYIRKNITVHNFKTHTHLTNFWRYIQKFHRQYKFPNTICNISKIMRKLQFKVSY